MLAMTIFNMSSPIKPNFKTEIFPVLVLILVAVFSFYFYYNFPEQVATHWNIAGEPDNWGSRTSAVFGFPLIMLGMYLLFFLLPYLDPKKDRYGQFRKVYHFFKGILVFFMAFIYFISGFKNLGHNISLELWIPVTIGILFMVLGNYMGKIKPNWFMGIRTPWTLSSEEVWNKTHRFSSRMFIIAGFLMVLTGIAPISFKAYLFIGALAVVLLGTIGYSYLAYRKKEKKK